MQRADPETALAWASTVSDSMKRRDPFALSVPLLSYCSWASVGFGAARCLKDRLAPPCRPHRPLRPRNCQPSYGFEFSNLVFRDGRTFQDIKEVQRAEWGNAVPILRAFGYEKVINMAYSGDLYETDLNWEWDPATLDIVAQRGWGPGLSEGEFTNVRVLDAAGAPVANAEVWADGRHYSFDLPNRPFSTDAQGFVQIPLGVDLDRTVLGLRAVTGDGASPLVAFSAGDAPRSYELRIDPAQVVGGSVIDARGQPLGDCWVYLKNPDGRALTAVRTDAFGRWTVTNFTD